MPVVLRNVDVYKLAGHWPDRELAVSLNRMRCKTADGETWTTIRVKEMRERLGLPSYDPVRADDTMISLMKAAERLGICVGSAKSLVLRGISPATQIVPGSPWLVPVAALSSETVRIGVQRVIARRPKIFDDYQANGPLFLGEKLSAVDFYLVMLARWARPMGKPPRSRPNIAKLLDKVTALPSVRRAYEREGIADEIC